MKAAAEQGDETPRQGPTHSTHSLKLGLRAQLSHWDGVFSAETQCLHGRRAGGRQQEARGVVAIHPCLGGTSKFNLKSALRTLPFPTPGRGGDFITSAVRAPKGPH